MGVSSGTGGGTQQPSSAVVDRIIMLLPTKKLTETVTIWRNALRQLADPAKRSQHPTAAAVLDAIRQDWTRRREQEGAAGDLFRWPSTEARAGYTELDTDEWLEEGLLKFVGYKVGTDGEVEGVRQRLLEEIFKGPIPPAFPPAYLKEWGEARSSVRLEKLARTIAALTRNAKRRRDSKLSIAIRDWERDLEFLYLNFYVDYFHFEWPDTIT
jgi:hypothetical protein